MKPFRSPTHSLTLPLCSIVAEHEDDSYWSGSAAVPSAYCLVEAWQRGIQLGSIAEEPGCPDGIHVTN